MLNIINMGRGGALTAVVFAVASLHSSFPKNSIYYIRTATEQVWTIFILKKFQPWNKNLAHHITLVSVLPRESWKHVRSSQLR